MLGGAFQGEGTASLSLGGEAGGRGSGAGREVGPRPARGRAASQLPAPGPPLRGAILQAAVAGTTGRSSGSGSGGGGHCGAEARRQDGSPASCSQVRAGPPATRRARRAALAGPGRAARDALRPRGRPGTAPARCHQPRGAACAPSPRPVVVGPVDARRPPVPAGPGRVPGRSQLPAAGAAARSGPQAAPRGVKWGPPGTGLASAASSPALCPRVRG